MPSPPVSGREFFTTRTVSEVLAGFRPTRRTAVEVVPLDAALHRVLELAGAVRMGCAPDVAVPAGGCVAPPTGGVLPAGADAVVMVEYTA